MREIGDVNDPIAVDQLLTRAVADTSHDGCAELELRKAVLDQDGDGLTDILTAGKRGRDALGS